MMTTVRSRWWSCSRLAICVLLIVAAALISIPGSGVALGEPTEDGDVVTQSDDLDGDDVADTVTAAPDGDDGDATGEVAIASGSDGSTATLKGNESGDKFGESVAVVGPDSTGVRHLLIGAPNEADTGRVYFFEGPFTYDPDAEIPASEALYILQSSFDLDGNGPADYAFGKNVGPLFDVTGDGVQELRVASLWDDAGIVRELMQVFDGSNAELLFIAVSNENFDPWMNIAGDLNGDGLIDQADVDIILEQVAAGGDATAFPDSDLNGDGAIDGVDVALVVDALGQAVLSVYLGGDGEGVGVYTPDGVPVDAYFPQSAAGGICCCSPGGDRPCECPQCGPGYVCPPDQFPCDDSLPGPCAEDPCAADCDTAPCNPDCGGDPCAPECEDSGFPCDDDNPCLSDPCGPGCDTAPCDPACGGDPCAPDCESAPCNPACGGDPCAPDCANPPCQNLEDCDGGDDDPEHACVGEEKTIAAPLCPQACQQGCQPGEWEWEFANPGDASIAEFVTDPPIGESITIRFNDAGAIDLVADNGCCRAEIAVAGVKVDLDIDSDNNNGYDPPDGTSEEDDVEAEPDTAGKLILVNDADSDADGVPDFADGFNFDNDSLQPHDNESAEDHFVPINLTATSADSDDNGSQETISFDYDASDPAAMETLSYGRLAPAPGSLRLWTRPASEQRDMRSITAGGHYVPADTDVPFADLDDNSDGTVTLWLEAVRASAAIGDDITVEYHDCTDTIHVTAYTTQYVSVSPDGIAAEPSDFPQISHPTPTIDVTGASLSNVRPAGDGVTLIADLFVSGYVDDALADLYGGGISTVGVFINDEPVIPHGGDGPVSIPVSPAAGGSSDPLLKPNDFIGGFTSTIVGVPVGIGVNTVTLRATNSHEYTGFASHTFTINATAPPDIAYDVQLALSDNGSTGYQLMIDVWYGQVGALPQQWITPVPVMPDPDDPGVYSGKLLGSLIEVGGMHDHVHDPGKPDTLVVDVWIENIIDQQIIVTETADNSGVFEGDTVLEDHERPTWDDFTFSVTHIHADASDGGRLVPYAQEVVPADMHEYLTLIEVFDDQYDPSTPIRVYSVQEYIDRSFLTLPEVDTPSLITLLENPNGNDSFFQTLQTGDLEDLLGAWAQYNVGFAEGFVNGLWDTGVALVHDIGTIAKGAWHLGWHYNQYAVIKRLVFHAVNGEGHGVILDEDQEKLEALGEFGTMVADVAFQVMQDNVDAAYALLTHDEEELNRLGEEYRIVGEYLIDILDAVRDEVVNASGGELGHAAGWISGRVTGEVLLEVLPALATGGGSLSFRAARITETVGTIATKFDDLAGTVPNVPGLSPQLMHTIADKVEDMADYLSAMATTTMCFVAGTPVHTIEGLMPIEEVCAGDLVLSRNERTGSMGYKPVVQTFVTHPGALYTVTYKADGLQCDDEDHEILTGTGEHPFYVVGVDAFVLMHELKIGDQLLLDDGIATAYVTDIQVQRGPPEGGSFTTYNFEVADWHTYFVGGSEDANGNTSGGVWVHNTGPACQRAFAIIERIKRQYPDSSHWDAFQEFLWRTASDGRRKATDPAMTGVVRILMETTYADAILPDGTIDLTKVKTVSEIRAFRNQAVAQDRLPGDVLHNHHVVPQEWARVLYKQVHGTEPTQQWLDSMPGWLMEIKDHVPDGYGSASFHDILRNEMRGVDLDDTEDVLVRIERTYGHWDSEVGPDIFRIAVKWLETQGIQ